MNRAQRGQLALLLEVASTPKPGNVDRHREYPDLRFEHFVAGAVGAYDGLEAAAGGARVGRAFERAVRGMSHQRGGNTQFGALLVVVPLVCAAADGELSPASARATVEATGVEDAKDFYRAFDHVEVAVEEPPEDMVDLDVRRGSDATGAIDDRGLTLYEVMERSTDRDGLAREWVGGFPRTFRTAERLLDDDGPVPERASRAYLELLAAEPDTFVAIQHDGETADWASERAQAALDGAVDPEALGEEFVAKGVNPGTTADIVAGGLYVALERGLRI